jgi:hypothetical protein
LSLRSRTTLPVVVHGDGEQQRAVSEADFISVGRYWVYGETSGNSKGGLEVYVNRVSGEVRTTGSAEARRNTDSPQLEALPASACGFRDYEAFSRPYVLLSLIQVVRCGSRRAVLVDRCHVLCNSAQLLAGVITWTAGENQNRFEVYVIRRHKRYSWVVPRAAGGSPFFHTRYALFAKITRRSSGSVLIVAPVPRR